MLCRKTKDNIYLKKFKHFFDLIFEKRIFTLESNKKRQLDQKFYLKSRKFTFKELIFKNSFVTVELCLILNACLSHLSTMLGEPTAINDRSIWTIVPKVCLPDLISQSASRPVFRLRFKSLRPVLFNDD